MTGYAQPWGAPVTAHPTFPELEHQVLAYWEADSTFRASIEARPAGENGSNEFVFYDGPPFANGLPHYGHLLTGYVKDVVPRFKTMRGARVERRFGWDTHGMPAEVEAERQLGIKHKNEITAMGVAEFNDACRDSVLRYTHEWQEYVTRQARWVDFEHDYKTLDLPYMESVLWAFKSLWDKGLIYEGYRVLWYCWRCETPLSATETRMDDVYRPRQDPAVTVALPLVAPGSGLDGVRALVWTTTPWTLPSNLAAAVNPDVDYVVVRGSDGDRYLLAQARVAAYARELGESPEVLSTHLGSELVGTRYTPPFDFFVGRENAHQVLAADYVTTEDGTGVVHIAPAFGEEDKVVTDAAGIEVANPVNAQGVFTSEVPPYEGMQIFDANPVIIGDLREAGLLLRRETYDHPYPHCWRCETPLIQRAVTSWFVAVTSFRDRMVELNQQISWVPAHIKDGQFGKWLAGARDWSISRDRFWGSPIPVWVSDDPRYPRTDVYGSLADLEADFGVPVTDLHRPFVDELTRPNPDDPTGNSTMRRVPQVLDCWFESGSMPFAQVHYPFENASWFLGVDGLDGESTDSPATTESIDSVAAEGRGKNSESVARRASSPPGGAGAHYPGDFIVEYNGQTRGWFYTLHVLATALFDRPAFRTCVAHGIVLGDDGQKMSKSRRNYPDVGEVFERDGSDAMRWFLMSSAILRGADLVVTEGGIRESVRQAVLPLWNAWYFLSLYAGASDRVGTIRTDSSDLLDRYVLGLTSDLVRDVGGQLDAYDIAGACATVRSYLEVLTNWYIRRSRARFWAGDADAIDTLHTVLETVCRVVAPLLPLTAEHIWRALIGGRSVHLTDYPSAADLPADAALVAAMAQVREVASVALSLRKSANLRVRQPLASLTVVTPNVAALHPFSALLADEVNVRSVVLEELSEGGSAPVERKLTVNARAAGPRLGKQVQQVIKASKSGDWSVSGDVVTCGGVELAAGEYTLELVAAGDQRAVGVLSSGGFVELDTALTDELRDAATISDVISAVQAERRRRGFDVSDRIELALSTQDQDLAALLEREKRAIASPVLARSVVVEAQEDGSVTVVVDWKGGAVPIQIEMTKTNER